MKMNTRYFKDNFTAYDSVSRLQGHPKAACHVSTYNCGSAIDFYSYSTRVITVDFVAGTIECTGTYSATTSKQIGWFLREYLPEYSYYDCKAIAGKGPKKFDRLVRWVW